MLWITCQLNNVWLANFGRLSQKYGAILWPTIWKMFARVFLPFINFKWSAQCIYLNYSYSRNTFAAFFRSCLGHRFLYWAVLHQPYWPKSLGNFAYHKTNCCLFRKSMRIFYSARFQVGLQTSALFKCLKSDSISM